DYRSRRVGRAPYMARTCQLLTGLSSFRTEREPLHLLRLQSRLLPFPVIEYRDDSDWHLDKVTRERNAPMPRAGARSSCRNTESFHGIEGSPLLNRAHATCHLLSWHHVKHTFCFSRTCAPRSHARGYLHKIRIMFVFSADPNSKGNGACRSPSPTPDACL
ncbi:unnamed protein product, partial [Musa banksii]